LYTQTALLRSPGSKSPSRFADLSREVSGTRVPRALRSDRVLEADFTAKLGRCLPQTHHRRAHAYFPRRTDVDGAT
jgi:hypothetical protein